MSVQIAVDTGDNTGTGPKSAKYLSPAPGVAGEAVRRNFLQALLALLELMKANSYGRLIRSTRRANSVCKVASSPQIYRRARLRFGPGTLAVTVLALLPGVLGAETGPKFHDDDPMTVEPQTQDAATVTPLKINLFYDLALNQFARPGLPIGPRAQNANSIDEVPDSSWFTNRILSRPLSIEEAVRGPAEGNGPAPGSWTVVRAKSEGAAPGFTIRDSAGVTWFLAFDPKSNPEGASGAAVVASKIFWALGYNQAEYFIAELRSEDLTVDPTAIFDPPSGIQRPMTLKDIHPVLRRAARKVDGSYRVLASRLLPGKILGGFKYYGTRPDDPNDVVPHEHRRELRALKVFGAWTNMVDLKALNTMDTLVVENGQSHVRHYLLDVGSTFGMGANGPREWTEGYEYLFEQDKSLKRMISLGFYLQPWQTVRYKEYKSIGRFEGDEFDPEAWKSRVPASAVLRTRDDDLFWAARRVMAFSDEMIRAIVGTGQYSDAAARNHLAQVLIKRRDKIGQAYLNRVNPLIGFAINSSDVLTFENVAVKSGVSRPPSSYVVSWFGFDNLTHATRPFGETTGSGKQLSAPAGLPSAPGNFIMVEVRAAGAPHPSWQEPVKAYFRRLATGWKLVGLERMVDDVPAVEPTSQTTSMR